jgi:signal transduction histidine kinase
VYAGICLYEDFTENLLLERDLRQSQKLQAVGQLAAGIAHEINTPMQYIGDNIRFLNDSFQDIAKVLKTCLVWREAAGKENLSGDIHRRLTDAIEEADITYFLDEISTAIEQSIEGVGRVEKIVRAMKDFSHPGSDEKKAANINKILESTVTVSKNEWKYVAEMEMDCAADLPLVLCLASELSQVFLNIIVNSAHAIADVNEGSKKEMGKISIRTKKIPYGIEIRITDTGGGIPEHIQERVFEPFFTTKIRGKGTGQGLAIAHRVIVDKHQGRLSFASEQGRGTTFIIELPTGDDEGLAQPSPDMGLS